MKKIERVWHPWEKWECYKHGFFGPFPKGLNKKEGELLYKSFFEQEGLFEHFLSRVLSEWKYSCEHNLTSPSLNKIAWGGQAAACLWKGIPAECRSGYSLLSVKLQEKNNLISESLIKQWYKDNGYEQPKTLY